VGTNLVGADVVEVSPPCDSNDITSLVAAQLLFEIASLFAVRGRADRPAR